MSPLGKYLNRFKKKKCVKNFDYIVLTGAQKTKFVYLYRELENLLLDAFDEERLFLDLSKNI
jgi:hypothetical protein